MPDDLTKLPRAKLPLMKGTIIDRSFDGFTLQFGGFRVKAKTNMSLLDLRDGDILTAYVEVLLKPPTGAA